MFTKQKKQNEEDDASNQLDESNDIIKEDFVQDFKNDIEISQINSQRLLKLGQDASPVTNMNQDNTGYETNRSRLTYPHHTFENLITADRRNNLHDAFDDEEDERIQELFRESLQGDDKLDLIDSVPHQISLPDINIKMLEEGEKLQYKKMQSLS